MFCRNKLCMLVMQQFFFFENASSKKGEVQTTMLHDDLVLDVLGMVSNVHMAVL